MAVDRSKFRTCDQTGFCRTHRHETESPDMQLVDLEFHETGVITTQETHKSLWKSLTSKSDDDSQRMIAFTRLTGMLKHSTTSLHLAIAILPDATVRMRITDPQKRRPTYDELVLESDILKQPDELPVVQYLRDEALSEGLRQRDISIPEDVAKNVAGVAFGDASFLYIQLSPFYIVLYQGKERVAAAGKRFYFDSTNVATPPPVKDSASSESTTTKQHDKEIVGYWEDGLAIYADGTREERKEEVTTTEEQRRLEETKGYDGPESFGGHTDSKPNGPQSVGMQLDHFTPYLYGIPEHASSTTLKSTVDGGHYKEPYRLYNLDVFEYELDETMALYGSIPLLISHSQTSTTGLFWFNPSETFVDVKIDNDDSHTYWMSESGIVDLFFLAGPTPADVYRQYMKLTGPTPLPPMFSLGYHQCRWNYKNQADVYQVHDHFEEYDYPYDVLWLDIEHTDDKRYFTWDSNEFPSPKEMQEKLAAQGRRMVTIVDPHIKRDNNYYIHKQATAKGLYIKKEDGKDFDGWCWPGASSYLDFTDANVRQWWAEQFKYSNYKGSTEYLFTWNDMNEPSVFNGPEVSMSKTLLNLAGHEHRDWHNLYGMLFQRATMEGLIQRNSPPDKRPFVLSRAFFAGSQKYGAIWTGDNTAEWGHLEVATPMLLSLNAAGLYFVGADVGGFFGDPDAELMTRWMQAAAYQPFFRGHAHHDSKRREPWMFGEETLRRLRRAAMARYSLLPYWYTIFWHAEQTGMPVMRTLWMEFPKSADLFSIDDQFMVGSSLLVRPVTIADATEVDVVFPSDSLWYDAESLQKVTTTTSHGATQTKTVPAGIDVIPVYQRGGSIISRKLRLRRSTMMMKIDPYTLYIALDENETASGKLHIDDEDSFAYQKGDYTDLLLTATATSISNSVQVSRYKSPSTVERILLAGLNKTPKRIAIQGGEELDFAQQRKDLIIIRKPDLIMTENWSITIEY